MGRAIVVNVINDGIGENVIAGSINPVQYQDKQCDLQQENITGNQLPVHTYTCVVQRTLGQSRVIRHGGAMRLITRP